MGLLLYRLGMADILEEKYDDALDVLTALVARFPENPDSQDAKDMIRTLTERARFTPYTIGCVLLGAEALKGGYFRKEFKAYRKYLKPQLAASSA